MNKVTEAVAEINRVIGDVQERLESKYKRVVFTPHEGLVDLKCYQDDILFRSLNVTTDHIGPAPSFPTGLEYQKKGGHRGLYDRTQEYNNKNERIKNTDGLKIVFGGNCSSNQLWNLPEIYYFERNEFLKQFSSHFFS